MPSRNNTINNIYKLIVNKDFLYKYISLFIIINIIFFFINNINDIYESYKIDILDLELILILMEDYIHNNVINIIIVLLFTVNLLFYIEYIRLQRTVYRNKLENKKYNVLSNIKELLLLFLAIITTGCISCGVIIFGGIINLSILTAIPYLGEYFNYFVLLLIVINNYYLYKKLINPYVC